ncbi:MAG: hypothetical protein SP1CHLAM54_12320 [Chlamydiia bacterium]|nr:hypothetical protein [Chlamydiia bacterium]MCH9616130.1 hypothetical protein [Chlamydiia bacterium]MCH9629447.1 hypothetical protein [Chlamydiia bacterium]
MTIPYIILALLGLSFLVFIHEMGHYLVAKWTGMKVEVFSIGFGKAIKSWDVGGVKWQIGWLPFGGFVKIAGMQREKGEDPFKTEGGFFTKGPLAKLAVVAMGPIVNIVFAFLVFVGIFFLGGREKQFAEYTKLVGWVDPSSELYELGVRPGAELTEYNGESYQGFKDLMYASIANGHDADLQGFKIDYFTGEKKAFDYTVKPYEDPRQPGTKFKTVGIMSPASYQIYPGGMPEKSPAHLSGIEPGDRIIWADGSLIFSREGLQSVINDSSAMLTVQRDGHVLQLKVPRMAISDIQFSHRFMDSVDDWHFDARVKTRLKESFFIPFMMSKRLVVMGGVGFVSDALVMDEANQLRQGDRILGVDGKVVRSPTELMSALQYKEVQMIVHREAKQKIGSWQDEDAAFFKSVDWKALGNMVARIGTGQERLETAALHVLKPVVPMAFKDFPMPEEQKAALMREVSNQIAEAENLGDPDVKREVLKRLEQQQNRLILGIPLVDKRVNYNPEPVAAMTGVFSEMYKNLSAVISGRISPKYLAGPVGIVHVMQHSWQQGVTDALFWLGVISLNLGVLNLLPIPVLDGGYIVFALAEMVSRKRFHPKYLERLVIPFTALLLGFFVYVTYHDIMRLVKFF